MLSTKKVGNSIIGFYNLLLLLFLILSLSFCPLDFFFFFMKCEAQEYDSLYFY